MFENTYLPSILWGLVVLLIAFILIYPFKFLSIISRLRIIIENLPLIIQKRHKIFPYMYYLKGNANVFSLIDKLPMTLTVYSSVATEHLFNTTVLQTVDTTYRRVTSAHRCSPAVSTDVATGDARDHCQYRCAAAAHQ
ncbi:hypothetical protein PPL_01601 [Heterostelium album PN500]|uniref:Uncharacterized protein n=1 Tax=Heterostelium pallidum (strain ATCC 26659 / Pp 5 / PN500) TaxID=670386 RepID=D3AZY7_HETP5|nr:hypothetical protein PPL_01601 [Heterostelium album PN500]EFA84611.1 hypothetical protein PPL_01601 [Heterostelium album PN500]|eukprot:XP_020436724.1 hypothetical protein PPL_01601 [Heterostelium album PN500]